MSPDRVAATLAAGLAADPPEIGAARLALAYADSRPRWAFWRRRVAAEHLGAALEAVDYLRGRLAAERSQTLVFQPARGPVAAAIVSDVIRHAARSRTGGEQ